MIDKTDMEKLAIRHARAQPRRGADRPRPDGRRSSTAAPPTSTGSSRPASTASRRGCSDRRRRAIRSRTPRFRSEVDRRDARPQPWLGADLSAPADRADVRCGERPHRRGAGGAEPQRRRRATTSAVAGSASPASGSWSTRSPTRRRTRAPTSTGRSCASSTPATPSRRCRSAGCARPGSTCATSAPTAASSASRPPAAGCAATSTG